MPRPPHPVDAAIAHELAAIKRDIERNPEDPTIDARIAALTERSAARDVTHYREQAKARQQERADAENGFALAFVVAGQLVERAVVAVAGFHAAGGFRGLGRRRGWWR